MSKMVLGTFTNQTDAENAVNELRSAGYDAKDMSIIMKDKNQAQSIASNTGTDVASGAAQGAVTGGALGAIAGLLIGVGAIAIPGIGGLLIGGPIAAALGLGGAAATTVSGAVTGALAGGLVGALVNLGVPEEDARTYEETVKNGGILVAVPSRDEQGLDVRNALSNNNAQNVSVITMRG